MCDIRFETMCDIRFETMCDIRFETMCDSRFETMCDIRFEIMCDTFFCCRHLLLRSRPLVRARPRPRLWFWIRRLLVLRSPRILPARQLRLFWLFAFHQCLFEFRLLEFHHWLFGSAGLFALVLVDFYSSFLFEFAVVAFALIGKSKQ